LWDGHGALIYGARWNSPGRGPIYAAETYSGALLEMLVRLGRVAVPPDYQYLEIDIPNDLARQELTVTPEQMAKESATRALGNVWYDSLQSAVLLVPSVVTLVDRNILISPKHPDFGRIVPSEPKPVYWDSRLFRA
jgi:RES domain-containing protein